MKKQERMENKKRKTVALANLIASNEIDGKSKKPKRKHDEISSESEEKVASTSSELVRTMKFLQIL
jgi:primase-polymerase (primpol)-like protein